MREFRFFFFFSSRRRHTRLVSDWSSDVCSSDLAEMMGELVTQGPLDLGGEQSAVVAEVALQGVAIDHDPVLEAVTGDAVAEVLAVGADLGAQLRDDDRDLGQNPLEFLREAIDRVDDQLLEL